MFHLILHTYLATDFFSIKKERIIITTENCEWGTLTIGKHFQQFCSGPLHNDHQKRDWKA